MSILALEIRKNIALGPAGLGQYFPVLSLPLGLGGVIRTLCPILISQFQACNKSQYCLGPSVTGPHRKRCLNIYHGLHCIRTDQWKGISILTMVNIEIRTSRTMQGRINKEMKFNISHGWYWNKSNRTLKGRINKDMNSNIIHGWYWNKSI